jgi:hypothetical protein
MVCALTQAYNGSPLRAKRESGTLVHSQVISLLGIIAAISATSPSKTS